MKINFAAYRGFNAVWQVFLNFAPDLCVMFDMCESGFMKVYCFVKGHLFLRGHSFLGSKNSFNN